METTGEKKRNLTILYFICDYEPTPEERSEGEAIAAMLGIKSVAYRNATLIREDGAIEPNDGVCGFVPDNYSGCKQIKLSDKQVDEPPSNQPTAKQDGSKKGRKGSAAEGWGKK